MVEKYNVRLVRTLRQSSKLLLWAFGITLLFGAIDFGEPLDRMLGMLRSKLQPVAASGDIVVVGVDAESLRDIGPWPWRRTLHAELIEKLLGAGADRIYFDFDFGGKSPEAENRALGDAIARNKGRVFLLPNHRMDDGSINDAELAYPVPLIGANATFVSNDVYFSFSDVVWNLPFQSVVAGRTLKSLASSLANVSAPEDGTFPVNYAIQVDSVPYVSAADVLAGDINENTVAGRFVVVAPNDVTLGDRVRLPGQTLGGGVYISVIGAETLKRGVPYVVSWIVPVMLAGIAMIAAIGARRWQTVALAAGLCAAVLVLLPLVLDASQIYFDATPALLLVMIVGGGHRHLSLKRLSLTNRLSGLSYLPADKGRDNSVEGVVSLLAVNLNEIRSLVGAEAMPELWEEIVRRLKFANMGAAIFHPEDDALVWLERRVDIEELKSRMEGLDAIFRSPLVVGARMIDLQISCGIDLNSGLDFDQRITGAILSAKSARDLGRRYEFYEPYETDEAAWNLSMLGELDSAMAIGHIWVAFQPQRDLRTGAITGAEALVRWSHPVRGMIGPDKFVPLAERHGRIVALTELVLDRSAAAIRELDSRGHKICVSVNISPFLVGACRIDEMVSRAASRNGISPGRFTLELTESGSLANSKTGTDEIDRLKKLGTALSIDDYGTGMATLEHLRACRVSELKIDRTFVSAIGDSEDDRIMVQSTIQLAHQLQMKVVAEGVETKATMNALAAMGCDTIQGYLVAKPLPLKQFISFLEAWPAVRAA